MSSFFERHKDFFFRHFSLDLRALACLRIGAGLLLMIDLAIRSGSIIAHYTNAGVLPVEVLDFLNGNDPFVSFHALSGSLGWQVFLFLLAFVFAGSLALGFKTRIATIASWLLLMSVHNRNPFILQGGDDLLRMVLFWGIFIPWGKRYSLDARNLPLPATNRYLDVPGVGYMFLIFSVYFFSALAKDSPEWRTEGTAIYYALSLDQMLLPAGKAIYHYPLLLKCLTFFVFYLELLGPFLFFIPSKNSFLRMTGVVLFIFLHIGIASTLYVGLFWLIGIVTLMGLIPASIMDRIESKGMDTVKEAGIPPLKAVYPGKWAADYLFIFLIGFSMLWCVSTLPHSSIGIENRFKWFGYVFRLNQSWGMFAPNVFKEDGWYVMAGEMERGVVDINRNGAPADYSKPSSVVSLFESDRWRKYSENVLMISNSYLRPPYCNYLVRKWNTEHPDRSIHKLNIIYVKEFSLPDYKVKPVSQDTLCTCLGSELNSR